MRTKTPERRVTDLYSPEQLARVRTCVETVLNELEMSYEALALAINRAAGEHRCTKDTLNRLARIGKDNERGGAATNQALIGLLDLAYVSRIYTREDLRAIALGNPPLSASALEYHPEDRLPDPIEERVQNALSSVQEEKERLMAIRRSADIVFDEIRSVCCRLEEIEREITDKQKRERSDAEIREILIAMVGSDVLATLELVTKLNLHREAIAEFSAFLSGENETLSPFLRKTLVIWLETDPESPLQELFTPEKNPNGTP